MKIIVKTDVGEMSAAHHAVLEVAEEYHQKAPDTIFFRNKIDMGAIQIKQDMGEYEIDLDNGFVVYCIEGLVRIIKLMRPVLLYAKTMCAKFEDFIKKPVITNLDDETISEEPTEFDV